MNLSIPYLDIAHSQHFPPSVHILQEGGPLFVTAIVLVACLRNSAGTDLTCLLKESCGSTESLCLAEHCSNRMVSPRNATEVLRF